MESKPKNNSIFAYLPFILVTVIVSLKPLIGRITQNAYVMSEPSLSPALLSYSPRNYDVQLLADEYQIAINTSLSENGYGEHQVEVTINNGDVNDYNPIEFPSLAGTFIQYAEDVRSITVFHEDWGDNDDTFALEKILYEAIYLYNYKAKLTSIYINEIKCNQLPCGPDIQGNPRIIEICRVDSFTILHIVSDAIYTIPTDHLDTIPTLECASYQSEPPGMNIDKEEDINPTTDVSDQNLIPELGETPTSTPIPIIHSTQMSISTQKPTMLSGGTDTPEPTPFLSVNSHIITYSDEILPTPLDTVQP
jgi:hypothetical protein